ncbi:hypothetical protein F3Y22_tig00111392pilonHSYRG00374 [Hibiscus syriacus]|uniref:RNase H type-1 domain-containing protein n=1 Tax=Hibiscus syriacus TaxID=106335 RepID=A0A6A2XX12_HIBSY|nr:hypothetical protein F3Y22_tig00111392pilonHSYRG00374 [Hibiscus syriacus]
MEGVATIIERSARLVQLTLQARMMDKPVVTKTAVFHRCSFHWMLPSSPWIRLNTDAAWTETDGRARCGVAKDSSGTWLFGFSKFIGICLIIDAELWGAFVGLTFAWNAGFRQVILELDSMEALRILKSDYNGTHSLRWHINELRRRNSCVQIQHVLRNGNKVADVLAKGASLANLDPILIDSPPISITKLLLEDMLVLDSVNG